MNPKAKASLHRRIMTDNPSDEEIRKAAFKYENEIKDVKCPNVSFDFETGAKWMRSQLTHRELERPQTDATYAYDPSKEPIPTFVKPKSEAFANELPVGSGVKIKFNDIPVPSSNDGGAVTSSKPTTLTSSSSLDEHADFYFDNVMKCDFEEKRGFYRLAFGDGFRAGKGIRGLEETIDQMLDAMATKSPTPLSAIGKLTPKQEKGLGITNEELDRLKNDL